MSNCVFISSMLDAAISLANLIAEKSPVAVQGTKINLNYSRDHTADESLEYMVKYAHLIYSTII